MFTFSKNKSKGKNIAKTKQKKSSTKKHPFICAEKLKIYTNLNFKESRLTSDWPVNGKRGPTRTAGPNGIWPARPAGCVMQTRLKSTYLSSK